MAFNPMDIPPGTGPSLEGKPGQKWYQRKLPWVLAAAVILGAIIQVIGR